MQDQLLSLLVPCYNESDSIQIFFKKILASLSKLDINWEVICINDGSTDDTEEQIRDVIENHHQVKLVSFSRNFGKEAAMTAAIDYASGDIMIPIDADLQDPPEVIGQLIAKWREGYDVVYAKRVSRASDSRIKRSTAHWFYQLFNRVSDTPIPENVGDYRLMTSRVVEVIKQLPEKDRFMKGLYAWPGFKSASIEFERQTRQSGDSKFSYWKLWNFALSGITSFSTTPIRIGTYLGIFIAVCSFIYSLYIVTKTLLLGVDVPGYASIMVVVLFLGGVQLFCIGLLGEYIGRIYKEVKNRPLYIVDKTIGFD